jgi:SAM-dependent methyltransferase
MRSMLYGQLLSSALYTCCELGVVDLLGDRPRTAGELARACGAHEPSLRRLLRSLAAFGVLAESPDGIFAVTPLGATLDSRSPASLHSTALLAGRAVGAAWNGIGHTVRTGEPAFPHVHGEGFFDHLDARPELRAAFDASQERDVDRECEAIRAALGDILEGTVVDVGGGDGALLAHLADARPGLSGVLVDLPAAAAAAERRMRERGLADRCVTVPGDFFSPLPEGDVYLLREILHDWDDASCLRLLRNCRRAMGPRSRLAVVELLYDREPGEDRTLPALMDLYMMSLFSGGERDTEGFHSLITAAGLTLEAVRPLGGGKALLLCRPADRRS